MTNRYKMVNDKLVQLTDAEEKRRQAEEKAWVDDAPNRRMIELRRQRNILLAETDWMANSDVTMSDAWKTYRQALRDITTQTPKDNALSNIKFPEKPTE
tara:strand:+ start:603 stop:899 length:297 start_codon:yes stop_codon:yes gene_type:complete